jgi:hypothetical protein
MASASAFGSSLAADAPPVRSLGVAVFWLLTLWLVPVAAFVAARRAAPAWLWRVTGFAFGGIIVPASTGLYVLYYVGPVAALLGLIGLPLVLVHGGVGYDLALRFGLVRPNTPVEGVQVLYVDLLCGAVWSFVYAAVGWLIDWYRQQRRGHALPAGTA